MWLIPERRPEKVLDSSGTGSTIPFSSLATRHVSLFESDFTIFARRPASSLIESPMSEAGSGLADRGNPTDCVSFEIRFVDPDDS